MNIQTNQIITNMYISHQTSKFSQIQVLAHRPVQDLTGTDATGQYSTKLIRLLQSSTICMIYCVSVERLQESYSKKKKFGRELVWEKQGKRKYGAGEIEKLVMYNWVKNVRVFFFFVNFFLYNLNLTPKQRRFKTNINFNISSKTTSFWYQLKKKKSKLQHFNFKP